MKKLLTSSDAKTVSLNGQDDAEPEQVAALQARLGVRPPQEQWWACPAGDHPRSACPQELADLFHAEVLTSPALPPGPDALLVTGSTYLVGALRGLTRAADVAQSTET